MRFFESIANLPECNGICLLLESEVTRQWRALGEQKSVEIAPLFFRKFDGAGSALGPFRVSESVDTTTKSMRLSVEQSTKSSVRMVKHCGNGARTEYRTRDSRVPDALDDPGFAAAFVAFCALGLMGFWGRFVTTRGTHSAAMVEWGAMGLFALGWAIYVFGSSVVLLDNAIEKRTPFDTKRLRFDAIRGRRDVIHRNYDGSYIRYLTLVPKDSYLPSIRFQKFYSFDSAFDEWYNRLPDLVTAYSSVTKW